MKNPPSTPDSSLNRREALRRTLLGGLGLGAAVSLPQAVATPVPAPDADAPFVPENDYPFFGGEPDGMQ